MDKLVGDLFSQGRHQIAVLFEKSEVLLVGGGHDGIDLDGVGPPVPEKELDGFQRELPLRQRGHKLAPGDHLNPSVSHVFVKRIDGRLGRLR